MNAGTITGILIVFGVYLAISQVYFKKRLKIKYKKTGMFHEERNRYAVAIDGGLLVLFIASMISINVEYGDQISSGIVKTSPMFGLFFLLGISRGFEEWLLHRKEKAYYYEWLGSFLSLSIFLVLLIGEA